MLKALDQERVDSFLPVVDALKWVLQNHQKLNIKVVNLSTVSPAHLTGYWSAIDEARTLIRELDATGIFIVTAAGNDFKNTVNVFPADAKEAITVGSYSHFFSDLTTDFRPSLFSNFGYANSPEVTRSTSIFHESVQRNFNSWVFKPDVLAPGEGVFACDHKSCYLATGTSFAAALVTGALSQLLATKPKMRRDTFLAGQRSYCATPFLFGQRLEEKACAVRFDLETSD